MVVTPETQLQATSGERTIIYIEVGIAIFKLHFLGVTGNPDRESTSSMDNFLRDVSTEPAKYLLSLMLIF
jgi:hypothetical protein